MRKTGEDLAKVTPARRSGSLPLIVALLTAAALLPILSNGFVSWDDDVNFVNNYAFRGLGWDQLSWMWTTRHMGHYVPLSWMTLGADYLVWGMNPRGYHLTSLLLHALNAVILFAIARRLLRLGGAAPEPQLSWLAAVAALVFAIHPLRVESVAWATERRDVLCGTFYFLAVYAYLRRSGADRPVWRWYGLALVAAAAALLSKAMAVTLPALLVLLDVYPLRRIGGRAGWGGPGPRRAYLEKVPFVLLSLAATIIAFRALGSVPQLGLGAKGAVSLYSLGFYVWKSVLPFGLAPLYPMPVPVAPLAPTFLAMYGIVLAVTVVAVAGRRRRPLLAAGWVGFVLLLLPVLGLHQNGPQIAADRYTYLAGAVVGLLASAGVAALRAAPSFRAGVVLSVVAVLGVLTWRQTGVWHDSARLWSRVVAVEPGSSIGHNNLGNVLAGAGQLDAALAHYRQALTIDPRYAEAHNDLGVVLAKLRRPDEAIAHYREALAGRPGYAEAQANWGGALVLLGRGAEAVEHYRLALALDPSNAAARIDWGNELVREDRAEAALEQYRLALAARPGFAEAHDNWGVALMQLGRTAEAVEHFRGAAVLRPGDPGIADHLRQAEAILARGRP